MFRSTRNAALSAVAALSMLAGVPAAANAAVLFVGPTASAPGTSCAHPEYTSVQTAINGATTGDTIDLCGGSYAEQLQIEKAVTLVGKSGAKIVVPGTPGKSDTTCDHERNAARGGEEEDLISICTTGKVTLSGLALEAKWQAGTCNDFLYGIVVGGGATLEASKVTLDGAGAFPINGCQGGVGIQVGFGTGGQVGHATLSKDTIENYQKNGMTVDGPGSTATVTTTTITGAGPSNQGQNGIQVSRGAVATISKVTISGDECNIVGTCGYESASQWEEDGAGVLFYQAGSSSSVSNSKLSNNNIGVEYVSASPTRPLTPELTLTADKITGGYASVQLNQGNATLDNDKLTGALVGIDVNSYWEEDNSYAPNAQVTGGKIEGSKAAVQVESDLTGLAGELSLSNVKVKGLIVKEDPQYEVTE